jgi:hypothetical protein
VEKLLLRARDGGHPLGHLEHCLNEAHALVKVPHVKSAQFSGNERVRGRVEADAVYVDEVREGGHAKNGLAVCGKNSQDIRAEVFSQLSPRRFSLTGVSLRYISEAHAALSDYRVFWGGCAHLISIHRKPTAGVKYLQKFGVSAHSGHLRCPDVVQENVLQKAIYRNSVLAILPQLEYVAVRIYELHQRNGYFVG